MTQGIPCPCGRVIEMLTGSGRARKFCTTCRPRKHTYTHVTRSRECQRCKAPFVGVASAVYCSQKCKDIPRGPNCDVCNKPTWNKRPNERGFFRHRDCSTEEHGTRIGYRVQKCRCTECTLWNRRQVKEYKAKRKSEGRPIPRGSGGAGPYISPSVRIAVMERDEWTCQLCMEPLEVEAGPQSDWYPSLDHVIPQSQGGEHTVGNLRAAHRWCNSIRGDREYHSEIFIGAR